MPKKGSDVYGRIWTGEYRLRPTLFGVKLEERVELNDGSVVWIVPFFPVSLNPLRKE